jgi:hypothetical protein
LLDPDKVFKVENKEASYLASDGKTLIPFVAGHTKHEIRIDGIIPIKISFDRVTSKEVDTSLLDFDVNGLTFNKKFGLMATTADHTSKCKSTLCSLLIAKHTQNYIRGILCQTAAFVGEFLPGPHMQHRRKALLARIKKMLAKGWHVPMWDEEYPKVIITNSDSPDSKSCKICLSDIELGQASYRLRCNGTISRYAVCEDCFWQWLENAAENGRFITCPLCREKRLIFGSPYQLEEQNEKNLKTKKKKVYGTDNKSYAADALHKLYQSDDDTVGDDNTAQQATPRTANNGSRNQLLTEIDEPLAVDDADYENID